MSTVSVATRTKHYHGGAKGKVTGKTVQPAPAWRPRNIPQETSDPGSKTLISGLPIDVSDEEIVDLMKKTIGPVNVRDSFMIYNSKGVPRGMAVIAFTRGVDASRARARYNGKIIDGKRTIKLEIVIDGDSEPSPGAPKPQQKQKSLFDRLGPRTAAPAASVQAKTVNSATNKRRRQPTLVQRTSVLPPRPVAPVAAMRKRTKKGPKRVKKSVADLDREMEEYAAVRENEENGMMSAT